MCWKCIEESLVVIIGEVYMYMRARARCFHVSESTGSLSPRLVGPGADRGSDGLVTRGASVGVGGGGRRSDRGSGRGGGGGGAARGGAGGGEGGRGGDLRRRLALALSSSSSCSASEFQRVPLRSFS